MNFIKGVFSEDNGTPSFIRTITGVVVIVVLFNWAIYCLRNNVYVALGVEDIIAILGFVCAKVVQKQYESR